MTRADSPVGLTAVVRGRVQGVGFRWFVVEQAKALELTGWVRNTPAGTVEVTAEGPRTALEALLEALRAGPGSADVTGVQVAWEPATGGYSGFEVRATR